MRARSHGGELCCWHVSTRSQHTVKLSQKHTVRLGRDTSWDIERKYNTNPAVFQGNRGGARGQNSLPCREPWTKGQALEYLNSEADRPTARSWKRIFLILVAEGR
jgi:hypothetical protein